MLDFDGTACSANVFVELKKQLAGLSIHLLEYVLCFLKSLNGILLNNRLYIVRKYGG